MALHTGPVTPASPSATDGQAVRATAWPVPLAAAAVMVTAFCVPRLLSWPVDHPSPLVVLSALPLPVVGMVLTARRCGGVVGWLLLAGGVGFFVNGSLFPVVHRVRPDDATAAWLGLVANAVGGQAFVALALVVPLFPDGRLPSRKWRLLVVAAALASALSMAMLVVPWKSGLLLYPLVNPIGVATLDSLGALFYVVTLLLVTVVVGGVGALVVRWRRRDPTERAQLVWVLAAVGLSATFTTAVAVALAVSYQPWLDRLIILPWLLLVPLALAVGVSRFRLYDIDIVVSRSLTYGTLIVALAGLYAATVAVAGALVGGAFPSLGAAVLVAVCLAPLRDRLARAANRLVYGQRDEPYQALASLALRLEGQIPPAEVADAVVEGVADALRLPFVSLAVPRPGRTALVAAKGKVTAEVFEVELVNRGDVVGSLSVAAPDGQRLRGREQRLLHDLARHAAAVLAAGRLSAELEESRDRLAAVREQERWRIWSELHDGLGPLLTGVSFGLEAARNQVSDHTPADQLLGELGGQVRDAIGDVRRMVQELSPPMLAELGLAVAVDQQAMALARAAGFRAEVTMVVPSDPLPAALELAAYRIATEAITNAARHARPRRVSVCIKVSAGEVAIEVADDGIGLPDEHRVGGGLRTMRQRATDLGGSCTVVRGPRGGTVVAALLPRDGHAY